MWESQVWTRLLRVLFAECSGLVLMRQQDLRHTSYLLYHPVSIVGPTVDQWEDVQDNGGSDLRGRSATQVPLTGPRIASAQLAQRLGPRKIGTVSFRPDRLEQIHTAHLLVQRPVILPCPCRLGTV